MVGMEHFQTLIKERLGLKLESATPAVDRPVAKVDVKKVRGMMLSPSIKSTRSTAATLPLLLYKTSKAVQTIKRNFT